MTIPPIETVFGSGRHLPDSYLERPELEARVANALAADAHFVIWGEPRQGKSALLRKVIGDEDRCVIQCSYGHKRYDVYRMLLRASGASVSVERRRRRSRGVGARVTFLSGSYSQDAEVAEQAVEIDISNVNDVLTVVGERDFRKVVVLEDFHCLGRSTQRNIVQDLKVISEKSELKVAIAGAWADRGFLRALPGDLAAPLSTIEVPRWSEADLRRVLMAGERALEMELSADVAAELIRASQESVGLLQELARAVCSQALPRGAGGGERRISSLDLVDHAIDNTLQNGIGRLRWYVRAFGVEQDWRSSRTYGSYKGAVHAALVAPDESVRDGLPLDELLASILSLYKYEAHGYSLGDLRHGLDRVQGVNRKLRASPILGFDPVGERLQILDPLARLFLRRDGQESLVPFLPDEGRDTKEVSYQFRRRVLAHYGSTCAVCSVQEPQLLWAVRLSDPSGSDISAPEYGLALCGNHRIAWNADLFGVDPATSEVVCPSRSALGITREDLRHLPAQPSHSALVHAMQGKLRERYSMLARLFAEREAEAETEAEAS